MQHSKLWRSNRVNGRDWHKAVYDDQGNLLAEVFLVDYHSYAREINEEGQWGEWEISAPPQVLLEALESNSEPGSDVGPTGQVDGSDVGPTGQVDDPPGGAETFCGLWDLLDVTYLGEGMVGDTDVRIQAFCRGGQRRLARRGRFLREMGILDRLQW